MPDYLKGFLWSTGSVITLYLVLYFVLRYGFQTMIGRTVYFMVYTVFHNVNEPLRGTTGGSPYLWAHFWFWLWAMIVFAGTFLVYLLVPHR